MMMRDGKKFGLQHAMLYGVGEIKGYLRISTSCFITWLEKLGSEFTDTEDHVRYLHQMAATK